MAAVDVIVPAGIDDPRRPSGGNRYDRRVSDALHRAGWGVREVPVAGEWPVPADALARALKPDAAGRARAGLPIALVDGMLAAAAGDVVATAARRRPIAILVHMLFGAYSDAVARSEALALRSAHALIATSEFSAQRVRTIAGVDPARVHVATPGADARPGSVRRAGVDARPAHLLCPAAVTPAKGLDTLAAALAALRDDPGVPAWSCTCAGRLDIDPAFAARLRRRIADAGLDARITLAGPLDEPGMDAAYTAADLVVLPSRAETWGLVVTEAISRGIPVVTAEAGGVPEALGHAPDGARPGLLVPPGDADALAAALRAWLTDPTLRRRLRAAARSRAAALPGWDRTADAVARALITAAHAGAVRRAS